ncbi:tetratricopeptide repeat protein [Paraflavitalea soli]|uniref:Tetratricopeptide repeat protein n=2 Tax=Paraflavitalea soli TaxID=2315862 RepID=A0A3B7MNE6_9BACT|nr:tetratricopeptide repeat protein [Paraflavitalea soli]
MKQRIACFLLLIFCSTAWGQSKTDSLMAALNRAIEMSAEYDQAKVQAIQQLKQLAGRIPAADLSARFTVYQQLYEEYKIFNYDSAYNYARKLQQTATDLADPLRSDLARIKLSFILLSSGMFKEAYDSLQNIRLAGFPDSLKADYYSLMARYYYDLGDYDNDQYHTPGYNRKATEYTDSALQLFPPQSFAYNYYNGLKNIRNGKREEASHYFQILMNDTGLSHHELALTASTLSDNYIQSGKIDTAIHLLILAAIADIKSSTKETAAIFNLSAILFKQGDLKSASTYIEKALNDAFSYGARQRKIQVSAILPLIEAEKVSRVENEKRTVITYAAIVTLLLMALVALIIVIFRQLRKLKIAQQIITEANSKQQEINNKLSEANKFKDEYIGYFFNGNSEFYAKMEKFKKNLEVKVNDRKLEEIRMLANTINIKKEKEELLGNFDRIFLKLFPHFIEEFNTLFAREDQIQLKENELLNTDLRIFALIRMGIHDSENIARILEYSVNTINTYKTKIKNKSIIPNEEFEQRIMGIKSI